jgi:uncharacterized damage-inducible protein DinB
VEAWLRGPVEGVPDLLQPVAHALLQARDEVNAIAGTISDEMLWARPAGVASAGFHLQHLSGVLDRLFTYARDEALTPEQLTALAAEGIPSARSPGVNALSLAFDAQVESALTQLRGTAVADLTSPRQVGRAGLPSTVIGLLVHAAEHTTRHMGQLLVTARVVSGQQPRDG